MLCHPKFRKIIPSTYSRTLLHSYIRSPEHTADGYPIDESTPLKSVNITKFLTSWDKCSKKKRGEKMGGMTYPKPIMKVSELIKMGYPKDYLLGLYALPTQDFAWKQNVTKKNSPILFDTAKLEEYRQNQIRLEQQAKKRRVAVI